MRCVIGAMLPGAALHGWRSAAWTKSCGHRPSSRPPRLCRHRAQAAGHIAAAAGPQAAEGVPGSSGEPLPTAATAARLGRAFRFSALLALTAGAPCMLLLVAYGVAERACTAWGGWQLMRSRGQGSPLQARPATLYAVLSVMLAWVLSVGLAACHGGQAAGCCVVVAASVVVEVLVRLVCGAWRASRPAAMAGAAAVACMDCSRLWVLATACVCSSSSSSCRLVLVPAIAIQVASTWAALQQAAGAVQACSPARPPDLRAPRDGRLPAAAF